MSDKNAVSFAIGVDVGGTGIKVGLVDVRTGDLAFKRIRELTPKPSTPKATVAVIADCVEQLVAAAVENGVVKHAKDLAKLPLGVAFPGIHKNGKNLFNPNMDQSWIGESPAAWISKATGRRSFVINDADAAGLAEMSWGAGKGVGGVVILTTLGTGIGTAVFHDGDLLPNTELGHLEMNGRDAETQAAESIKVKEDLTYEQWAERLQQYYSMLEHYFSPDLVIVGGGVSKSHKEFLPLLDLRSKIVPAKNRNAAGIIGAAFLGATEGRTYIKPGS